MSYACTFPDGHSLAGDEQHYQPVSVPSCKDRTSWAGKGNVFEGSASDWRPTVLGALQCIRNECALAGWDGEGSEPITERTIQLTEDIAVCLFDLLPKGTPAPDVIPESDGDICISWTVDAKRIFSLSVRPNGMNFAGQLGKHGRRHGWQPIDALDRRLLEESLSDIATYINRLYEPIAFRRTAR